MRFWFKDLLVPIPYKFENADYPTESLEVYNISALIPFRGIETAPEIGDDRENMLFLLRDECSGKEDKNEKT